MNRRARLVRLATVASLSVASGLAILKLFGALMTGSVALLSLLLLLAAARWIGAAGGPAGPARAQPASSPSSARRAAGGAVSHGRSALPRMLWYASQGVQHWGHW